MNIQELSYEILSELSGIDVSNISETDTLIENLGLDSLALVELLLETEEQFEIVFEESDMNPYDLKNVADYIALIMKYIEVETSDEEY